MKFYCHNLGKDGIYFMLRLIYNYNESEQGKHNPYEIEFKKWCYTESRY